MTRLNLLESLSDNIVIDKDKCTACGICVNTCILDNLRLQLSPCRQGCPLGVNCQGYIQLIARGEEDKAMELMRETLPFPGILGRICSQPCEERCHHKQTDGEAVAIWALKYYLADREKGREAPLPDMEADKNLHVAVIGSGPAGMLAAYDLRVRGYGVSVFDAAAQPGGMLRWAIPEFRLPLDVLEKEIDLLRRMGVVFHTSISVGKEKTLDELKKEFSAIVIAIGCPEQAKLNTKGEDLDGVYHGLSFLRDVRDGKAPSVGKKVVVIGGGNVAVDAAQTALRLGADQVTMVCLEASDEVPAHELALSGALTEGVKLECSWGSVKFIADGNRVDEVEFQRCLNVFDSCGRFSPVFDSCELNILKADTVIVAIGQSGDEEMLKRFNLSSEKISKIDPLTLQTSDEMIFAAGDMATGPSSVIAAMANGRNAAESVHRYLGKEHMTYGRSYPGPVQTEFAIETERGTSDPRTPIKIRPCSGKGDFKEIERPFDVETARREAQRCYSCGQPFGKYRTCWFCLPCEVECPNDALYVEIPYLLR